MLGILNSKKGHIVLRKNILNSIKRALWAYTHFKFSKFYLQSNCCYILVLMLTCFYLTKGHATFFFTWNCCEFLASYSTIFQTDTQSYFKIPVCAAPLLYLLSVYLLTNKICIIHMHSTGQNCQNRVLTMWNCLCKSSAFSNRKVELPGASKL